MSVANTTAENVKNSIESGMNSVKGEFNEESSKAKLNQAYKLASEAASDAVAGVKAKAQAQFKDGQTQANELSEKAQSFIKEKPLVAVGAAVAAGWLLSKLLK